MIGISIMGFFYATEQFVYQMGGKRYFEIYKKENENGRTE
jgi:hypothetical protein